MVPPESDDNLRLEIGHVLFIDIVGYSKLLIEEQKERHDSGVTELLSNPFLRAYKDDPRFVAFAQKVGVMPKTAAKP
jgi:hypothetical protein